MKIAHIIPHSVKFPLEIHNGRYDWVLQLATLQVRNGHQVTIYCNPDSAIDDINTVGIKHATEDKLSNNIETFRVALHNNHDIYHSHFDNLHYEVANETTRPIVFTQHWWPHKDTINHAQSLSAKNVWAVPPTNYMHEFDRRVGIQSKGTVYHGIDLTLFQPVATQKTERLLFVGRISPEKNLDMALSIANKNKTDLDIIGKIALKNQQYYNSLKHLIDGKNIRYLGTKSHEELISYYSSARALIFPSDITEAFGLTAIEAQACGTPVIMKRGGSRTELIEEGKTGFLCETDEEFTTAIASVDKLRAIDCITFAKKFDINIMVQKYELLYRELLADYSS